MIRLNLGCGDQQPDGWMNVDKEPSFKPGTLCDVRQGLLLADDSVDYAVAHHSLQQFTHDELPGVVAEVRRVLKPGAVFRVTVPDVLAAYRAWERGNAAWFPHGPEVENLDVGLSLYLTWYSTARTLFTPGYLDERLRAGGFADVYRASAPRSIHPDPQILELDARGGESLFMEAVA